MSPIQDLITLLLFRRVKEKTEDDQLEDDVGVDESTVIPPKFVDLAANKYQDRASFMISEMCMSLNVKKYFINAMKL